MGKPNIEKMKAKRDVEGLIEALKDEDVQVDAVDALEKLGWVPKNEAERVTSLIAMRRWDELVKAQEPCIKALLTAYEKADFRLVPYPLAALWDECRDCENLGF